MRLGPELAVAGCVVVALAVTARGEEPGSGRFLDAIEFGSGSDPIVITSDTLEYDYKTNVIVYEGSVRAEQGTVSVRSDTLTVTLADGDGATEGGRRIEQVDAVGNVRIDDGPRWATGGSATFDQRRRTLTLSESPRLHDGSNEVAGDRVIVYLDEDRSVVEGGRGRVKAVLYPDPDEPAAAPIR